VLVVIVPVVYIVLNYAIPTVGLIIVVMDLIAVFTNLQDLAVKLQLVQLPIVDLRITLI